MMRTTVRLSDSLLSRAKREALAQGRTLTSLMEEGLLMVLDPAKRKVRRKKVVLPTFGGKWLKPGVNIDINNNAKLLDYLDALDDNKTGLFKC